MNRRIEIITLFPELFGPLFKTKVFERGLKEVSVSTVNLRDYASDKRRTVDDTPYGGGCGMILKPEPLALAIEDSKKRLGDGARVIYLSPQGRVFDQGRAAELGGGGNFMLICGRYEGIDQRVIDLYVDEELSIGNFILTGGELAAMVVLETFLRLIPGVLGNEESPKTDSLSDGLLKYPQYTRPEVFRGVKVPDVLLSGNHKKIEEWRKKESLSRTENKRPDLYLTVKGKRGGRKAAQI